MPQLTIDEVAFYEFYSLLVNIQQQEKQISELDSLQLQLVRDIASICPPVEASINARVVLEAFYKETLPPCASSGNARMFYVSSVFKNELKNYYLGNNIPNPFTKNTVIPYVIPMETEEAYISIHDVFGKLVGTYKINPIQTQIEVSLTSFESGVYYYSLTLNGEITETKRMVLIK